MAPRPQAANEVVGGQDEFRRMVRIHGNTVENIPLCALLMALYEFDGGEKMVLQAAGFGFIAGRILFAGPLWFHDGANPIWPDLGERSASTWATTALLAMLNILQLRS